MTVRPRKTDRHLPARVYRRGNTYYYAVPPKLKTRYGKSWINLGQTLPEALSAYARLLEGPERDTIAEGWEMYQRAVMPNNSQRTRADKEAYWERLGPVFGHCHWDDVKPVHVARYLDKRAERGGGQAGNKEIALLSHLYSYALRNGLAQRNPCLGVKRIPRPKGGNEYVTDATLAAWIAHAPETLGLLAELLYMTGLRPGDALGLRVSAVEGDTLSVKASKTGKASVRSVTPGLRQVIDALLERRRRLAVVTPYLLPNRDGSAYTVSGMGSLWGRHMRTFGGQRFSMKDLRAKYASDLEAHGQDATRNLQHSSRAITERHYLTKPATVAVLGRVTK